MLQDQINLIGVVNYNIYFDCAKVQTYRNLIEFIDNNKEKLELLITNLLSFDVRI